MPDPWAGPVAILAPEGPSQAVSQDSSSDKTKLWSALFPASRRGGVSALPCVAAMDAAASRVRRGRRSTVAPTKNTKASAGFAQVEREKPHAVEPVRHQGQGRHVLLRHRH